MTFPSPFRTICRLCAGVAAVLASLGAAQMLAPAPAFAQTQGIIPFTRAEVSSTDGHAFNVSWTAPAQAGDVDLYVSDTLDPDGALKAPSKVGQGAATGALIIRDLLPGRRWYFELQPSHGADLVIADRDLLLKSAPNFRDVGGYRTVDGRWVRMGLAYRSDQLNRLTEEDLATIQRLAPSLVIDLRTQAERQTGPDRLPNGAMAQVEDVLGDTPLISSALKAAKAPETTAAWMTQVNRTLVASPAARAAYSRLFTSDLITPATVVYHCTAGKDRTGWASAVLLTLLGVPRETVFADYLASNRFLVDKNKAAYGAMSPSAAQIIEPALTVRSAYLEAAFDEVDRRYGSFAGYLKTGLGLDAAALERLRARYLAGRPLGGLEERFGGR